MMGVFNIFFVLVAVVINFLSLRSIMVFIANSNIVGYPVQLIQSAYHWLIYNSDIHDNMMYKEEN